jgi:hypothetical protein
MSKANDLVLSREHPHSDRPNWKQAETADEYLTNCRERLEDYSDKRFCELMGWTRIRSWRVRMLSEIPEPLFDCILKQARAKNIRLSDKALAQVGYALSSGKNLAEVERCPHCGEVLRLRSLVAPKLVDIVNEWLEKNSTQLKQDNKIANTGRAA